MRVAKIIVIAFVAWAGIVLAFESLLGVIQPEAGTTLVITTTDASGNPHRRVVSRLESGSSIYVAANHWPRAWYYQALANPDVRVTSDGNELDYVAIPVGHVEHARVEAEHPHGVLFRILTGFPPRYFLRLEPKPAR